MISKTWTSKNNKISFEIGIENGEDYFQISTPFIVYFKDNLNCIALSIFIITVELWWGNDVS